MKNLTEFSGVILRQAAAVRSTKLAELKANAKAAPQAPATEADTAPVVADDPNGPAVDAAPADAPADDAAAESAPDDAAPTEEVAEAAPAADAAPAEPRIDDEALNAAVGEEMGVEGDKLGYLMGALKAVGRKGLDQVRKVRVFQGEQGPAGSFSIGELHFVVDRIVVASKSKDDGRGGKGGKGRGRSEGRGGSGGGGGGGGGGARPPAGPKGGTGFDSMRKDEPTGDVSGGLGWSLSRTPGSEKKEGRGRGKPGRKGPRRGKPGAKPGEDRKPNPNRNRNRNRKPRTDGGGAKAPEVTVKAPMVPANKPAEVAAKSVDVKPVEAPKSEA